MEENLDIRYMKAALQQAQEAVLLGHIAHEVHDQHVVVGGDVDLLVQGGQLELRRGDFVMTCLRGDAELVERALKVFHEGHDAGGNGAEIVVLHLLALGRGRAEEGAAGHEQVGALGGDFLHVDP